MYEWTIKTGDRGIVRMTGEGPHGYPFETWLNGIYLSGAGRIWS